MQRDRRLDGRFVYVALSTNIYCRPSCPARLPERRRVVAPPQLLDRIGLAIDYLRGASEISDTYVRVTFALTPVTTLAAGVFFDNDRSAAATTYDGFFAYLSTGFNVPKIFDKPTP